MRILDSDQMRRVDRAATEELGLPSLVLMENAAIGVADAIADRFPRARAVAIFCGPGSNGGDGLAVARHLAARGYEVGAGLVTDGKALSADAALQRRVCERQGIAVRELDGAADAAAAAAGQDLIVDALFGTGLARPLSGVFAAVVEALNRAAAPRLAIDLPSGLDASTHRVPGPHLRAQITVTFAAPKIAHLFAPACEAVGELAVADLGIPPALVESAGSRLELLTAEELAPYLAPRRADSHKGDYGHALLVAGSPGKAGAAILAARAAVRAGAGLVTTAVPETILDSVAVGSVESMTWPLPAAGPAGLAPGAVDAVLQACAGKDALAVGPGLGQEPGTAEVVRALTLRAPLPLVLDADGLNAFAGRAAELTGRRWPTLLTPHPGELARLLGSSTDDILDDRLAAARQAAAATGCLVVLKGHRSLLAAPAGDVWMNPTGNPGMATGGAGDVLTGVLVALLAQGYEAELAGQLGLFVHGWAGDLAAADQGERGLRAGDFIAALPRAFARLAAC
ncbi:MAG TPA: NAD(P)H-hydrate dehydratase [Thermoanaerobaculia bacterium]|nr:NAD(P)H-hydrate dehydratase [Thermoanaerobaculia bacterium]